MFEFVDDSVGLPGYNLSKSAYSAAIFSGESVAETAAAGCHGEYFCDIHRNISGSIFVVLYVNSFISTSLLTSIRMPTTQ